MRIYGHANKDKGNVKMARKSKHHDFADYIEDVYHSHGEGWLGISLRSHRNSELAKKDEVFLIKKWGRKYDQGTLFNRSATG